MSMSGNQSKVSSKNAFDDFEVNFRLRPLQLVGEHIVNDTAKRLKSTAKIVQYMAPSFMKPSQKKSQKRSIEYVESMPDFIFPSVSVRPMEEAKENKDETPEKFHDLAHLKPDLIIIGGGPVGLFSAIETKTLKPEMDILILERHQKYVRTQTLRIESSSIKHPVMKDRLQNLMNEGLAEMKKGTLHIRVELLETCLVQYAKELGINIQYKKIVSAQQIHNTFPDCPLALAADGAHSTIRRDLFDDELTEHPMQYLAKVDYKIQGKTKKMGFGDKAHPELLSDFYFDETVKYDEKKQDMTSVSANFFLDEKTFHQIKGGTFKEPLQLSYALPKNVKTSISVWLNTRDEKWLETPILTKIALSAYASEYFCTAENNLVWALIGDAAFGVPYFRSLNAGVQCATALAQRINKYYDGIKAKNPAAVKSFLNEHQSYMKNFFAKEFFAASVKDFFIDSGKTSVLMSAASPSQMLTWNKTDKKRQKLNPVFNDPTLATTNNNDNVSSSFKMPKIFNLTKLFRSSMKTTVDPTPKSNTFSLSNQ